jgi:hypothetical protein
VRFETAEGFAFSLFVSVGLIRFDYRSLNSTFFRLLLNSPFVEAEFDRIKIGGGTHTNKLNLGDLYTVALPLPPLAEQHRIVAKVDELMALCDRLEATRGAREATRDRLAAASLAGLNAPDPETFQAAARFALDTLPALAARPDQIKQLRQTILNLAVRGKLVPQDPTDEPASELLKRIGNERTGWQAIKKARRNGETEISGLRADTPLATGWCWTNIDEVALSMRYGTSIKCEYEAPGVPVLRIPNVSSGIVSLDDIKFGPLTTGEIRELALSAGDLLLIRSNGSLDIVGRSAIVTVEAKGMAFAGYLVRLRLSPSDVNPQYIWLALNSTAVRDQIEKAYSIGGWLEKRQPDRIWRIGVCPSAPRRTTPHRRQGRCADGAVRPAGGEPHRHRGNPSPPSRRASRRGPRACGRSRTGGGGMIRQLKAVAPDMRYTDHRLRSDLV